MKKAVLLLTLFAMLVTGGVVSAAPPSQAPDGEVYVVQPGDWLMKIARDFYGESAAYEGFFRLAKHPIYEKIDSAEII